MTHFMGADRVARVGAVRSAMRALLAAKIASVKCVIISDLWYDLSRRR